MFDGSGLQSILKEWRGAEITMPVLFKSTLLQLDELEARHGRGISWAEAIGNRELKLDVFARGDFESFLADIRSEYDSIAGHLADGLVVCERGNKWRCGSACLFAVGFRPCRCFDRQAQTLGTPKGSELGDSHVMAGTKAEKRVVELRL
jgi:hypothetical protein